MKSNIDANEGACREFDVGAKEAETVWRFVEISPHRVSLVGEGLPERTC